VALGMEIIAQIERDHRRLGRVLQAIDNGRWWSADEPGRSSIEVLRDAAARISESTTLIERLVGNIGTDVIRKQKPAASLTTVKITADL
jgi:hypothetical protein